MRVVSNNVLLDKTFKGNIIEPVVLVTAGLWQTNGQVPFRSTHYWRTDRCTRRNLLPLQLGLLMELDVFDFGCIDRKIFIKDFRFGQHDRTCAIKGKQTSQL